MSTELDHLLDRATRNVLLVAEGERLRELVGHLVAGQCVDSRRVCEQHHAVPVATCPYPRCLTAEQHPFEQHPAAPKTTRVCRCGKWPDHHIHTGDTTTCGCDACRATETDHA